MAHDLRSPLSSVISLAETLAQGRAGPVSAEQQRQLHLIYSAALYACAAASDMVELARGDRLAQQAPGGFAVSEVLAAVRDLVQPAVQAKALWLRVEPPRIDRRLGHARPLSRVLLNLTTNALRATEQGGVTITAHERGPQRILFSVADTGPGIDRDTLRTLFQPFRKTGADPHHHFSGSGLGLAICRTLVAAMGSELRVATTPGRGTEFAFELELPPLEGGR
jgi:signal transduction histidine kinase